MKGKAPVAHFFCFAVHPPYPTQWRQKNPHPEQNLRRLTYCCSIVHNPSVAPAPMCQIFNPAAAAALLSVAVEPPSLMEMCCTYWAGAAATPLQQVLTRFRPTTWPPQTSHPNCFHKNSVKV